MSALGFCLACLAGYLLGAVPTGLLLTRWVAGVDLRSVGSGNTGFSNATRVVGYKWSVWVLAFDVLKGFVPAFLFPRWLDLQATRGLGEEAARLAIAVTPVIGHCSSIFLKFRGGKGVATSMGVYLALAPLPLFIALGLGLVMIAATRYMSAGSMTGALTLAVTLPFINRSEPLLRDLTILIALVIVILHRANIQRLLNGTEHKLGEKIKTGGKP